MANHRWTQFHPATTAVPKMLAITPQANNHLCSVAAEEGNAQRKIISEISVTYCKMALCPLCQKTYLSLDGSVVLNSFSTHGHNNLQVTVRK